MNIHQRLFGLRGLGCGLALSWAIATPSLAENLRGADEALRQIGTPIPQTGAAANPKNALEAKADMLRKNRATLAPEEAAKQWLELFDLYQSTNGRQAMMGRGTNGDGFGLLVRSLPEPSAWEALSAAIQERPAPQDGPALVRDKSLRLFAQMLRQDAEGLKQAMEEIEPALRKLPRFERSNFLHHLAGLKNAGLTDQKPTDTLAKFESALQEAEQGHGPGRMMMSGLEVPDLVTIAGEEKAAELLRRAFMARNVTLQITARPTMALARKLATENLDKLPQARWELIDDLDSIALYEAMDRRFPAKAPATQPAQGQEGGFWGMFRGRQVDDFDENPFADDARRRADMIYVTGLIIDDRAEDAAKVVLRLIETTRAQAERFGMNHLDNADFFGHYQVMQLLENHGQTAKAFKFVNELLKKDPSLPLWDEFAALAARSEQTDEMMATVRLALNNDQLDAEQLKAVKVNLADLLLSADRIDEAVEVLRDQVKADPASPLVLSKSGHQLAWAGKAMGRKDWLDEGIGHLREALKLKTEDNQWELSGTLGHLVYLLIKTDRIAQAEVLLIEELQRAQAGQDADENRSYYASNPEEALVELAGLYHQAGRHADVLILLQRARGWNTTDLRHILTETDSSGVTVGEMAAAALADAGQAELAISVLRTVILVSPESDRAYERLCALQGMDAIAFFDQLYAIDAFEERPLIWKAHLLLKDGQIDEAEKVCTLAISVDPSDGEQGKDRRMIVYSVMADIQKARGNQNKEKFFRQVVAAIRMSEDADDLWSAGLLKQAIARYRQALELFADAYCIQSRLARQLMELGLTKQAEEHYRRAFELMPDSFGRMESHCFGCEGAFSGEIATSTAEKVFNRMLQENPNKPQLHYLLGYLRSSQNRDAEAADHFRQAVKLDPLYINAWKKLSESLQAIGAPAAERDAAALMLLRLDPYGRHTSGAIDQVTSLRATWETAADVRKKLISPPPVPDKLLALAASAEANRNRSSSYYFNNRSTDRVSVPEPGERVEQLDVVKAIIQMMDETLSL